jgi:hypothetical protein
MLNTIEIRRHKNSNNEGSDLYFCNIIIPQGLASYVLENYHYKQCYLPQENMLFRVQIFLYRCTVQSELYLVSLTNKFTFIKHKRV